MRALVTGAGSGIGAACAHRLADDGFDVTVADLEPDDTATDLGATAIRLDIRDEVRVAQAMEGVEVLVNAAGADCAADAVGTPLEVWNNVLGVNATGTFLCCKHAIPGMRTRGHGVIVNVASVAGLVGMSAHVATSAAHGAVIALTRALAVDEAAYGIRVNAVAPGIGETPLGRAPTTDEIADAVLYLATAELVTGTVLAIDGGQAAR